MASDFVQYNFATGTYSSGNPNFGGDPMVFGLTSISDNNVNLVYTAVYNNLTFDLVTTAVGSLTVTPSFVSFAGEANINAPQQQTIVVQNSGSGSLAFTASVVSGSPWVSIAPSSGTVAARSPVTITVTANAQALSAGNYRDVIHFASSSSSVDVPVTLFATNPGAILGASPIGALFNIVARCGIERDRNHRRNQRRELVVDSHLDRLGGDGCRRAQRKFPIVWKLRRNPGRTGATGQSWQSHAVAE